VRIVCLTLMALVCTLAVLVAPVPSQADAGEELLRKLNGEWRGRGTAIMPGRQKAERVTCSIENRWDAEASTLEVSGQCASSQGKSPVSGRLELKGGVVSGSFLGDFEGSTPTRSGGAVTSRELVVVTSFVNNATGALSQTRQVIRPSARGFSAEFFLYDNRSRSYEKSGDMEFSGS